MTSIAAFIGTIVGLLSDGHQAWQDVMLAVTAGGFVYVAAVSLIPSVLSGDCPPHSHSPPPSPTHTKKTANGSSSSSVNQGNEEVHFRLLQKQVRWTAWPIPALLSLALFE